MSRKEPPMIPNRESLWNTLVGRSGKPQPTTPQAAATALPPSRQNRQALTTWQATAAVKQLKQIALEEGTTVQALVAEGINDVFRRRGKPPIAS
jgi:hypothetical protein